MEDKKEFFKIKNQEKNIYDFFNQRIKNKEIEYHICIENTGKYSWLLESIIPFMNCKFYEVNPLHLKRSLGLVRGKNDKIDAKRIAVFIKKNHQEIDAFIPKRKELRAIQVLLSERKFKVEYKRLSKKMIT